MDYPLLTQDIFDTIIDNVWPDTDTLKNSALVSSAWLPSARSNLFYCIHLDPPTDNHRRAKESPCERLFTILKSSPTPSSSIGKYVREIYLRETYQMDKMSEWWEDEPTLPLLLRSLHNLRRFGFQSDIISIAWDSLPATLKTAIQDHVLCLPSLTELKLGNLMLNNISVMNNLLRSCRQLKVLELDLICKDDFTDDGVAHLEMGSMDEVVSERRLQLNVLGIRSDRCVACVALLLHPSSNIGVEKVRKLVLSISSTTFADCARLLHASLSVEQLELIFMTGSDLEEYWKLPSQHQFNLSLIPHLQTLKVHIGVVLRKVDKTLHWLKALLDSGSSSRPNAVVKIWIVYTTHLSASYRARKPTVLDNWVDIDALLCGNDTGKDSESGQNAYGGLKEVKLEFLLENLKGDRFAPQFLEKLVLDSPGLERRGILSINAFDSVDSFLNFYYS